jgi:hypothetical protein
MAEVILRTKDGWEKRMRLTDKARAYGHRIAVTRPFAVTLREAFNVTEPSFTTVDFQPSGEVIEIWEEI